MPNGNAYLALALSDATRASLVEVQQAATAELERQGVGFSPMAAPELHMTFCFAGTSVHALGSGALLAWHEGLARATQEAGAGLGGAGGCVLRMRGIAAFPPGKANLLVALFEAPAALHALQARVAAESRAAGVGAADASGDGAPWVPHVTLGKVRAPRAAVEAAASGAAGVVWAACGGGVDEGTGVFAPVHGVMDGLNTAVVDGLIMGGQAPRREWIDWRETLRFAAS